MSRQAVEISPSLLDAATTTNLFIENLLTSAATSTTSSQTSILTRPNGIHLVSADASTTGGTSSRSGNHTTSTHLATTTSRKPKTTTSTHHAVPSDTGEPFQGPTSNVDSTSTSDGGPNQNVVIITAIVCPNVAFLLIFLFVRLYRRHKRRCQEKTEYLIPTSYTPNTQPLMSEANGSSATTPAGRDALVPDTIFNDHQCDMDQFHITPFIDTPPANQRIRRQRPVVEFDTMRAPELSHPVNNEQEAALGSRPTAQILPRHGRRRRNLALGTNQHEPGGASRPSDIVLRYDPGSEQQELFSNFATAAGHIQAPGTQSLPDDPFADTHGVQSVLVADHEATAAQENEGELDPVARNSQSITTSEFDPSPDYQSITGSAQAALITPAPEYHSPTSSTQVRFAARPGLDEMEEGGNTVTRQDIDGLPPLYTLD